MAVANFPALQFKTCDVFGSNSKCFNFLPLQNRSKLKKSHLLTINTCSSSGSNDSTLVIEAKANTRTDSAKVRNRRMRKKFNGTPRRPRLSVFCSDKQLYAMLVDDKNKKCLFYGSTLQKSIRDDPTCTTSEAAKRVGEELVKACVDLNINEISYYDRNGFARGERMQAFEIAIAHHGFLPR